jgi:hypothetical protein
MADLIQALSQGDRTAFIGEIADEWHGLTEITKPIFRTKDEPLVQR